MKKFLSFGILALLLAVLVLPARAAETPEPVCDQAGLLTAEERSRLAETASELGNAYQMDIVISTVESLAGQRPGDFADEFYWENGYGENGVLFLLAMEERDWYLYTAGDAIYALTDYGIQAVAGEALPYLSAGEYYRGFSAFLTALPSYLEAFQAGAPVDGRVDTAHGGYREAGDEVVHYEQKRSFSLLPSLLFGLVPAAAVVLAMGAMMNTKRPQGSAGAYMDEDSFQLEACTDRYLYSSVTKTRIQQESAASGGGSSVHTASSGRKHGGGGGKF